MCDDHPLLPFLKGGEDGFTNQSVIVWTFDFILQVTDEEVSFRRKPESRIPGENRDPVSKMAPDFRRDRLQPGDRREAE